MDRSKPRTIVDFGSIKITPTRDVSDFEVVGDGRPACGWTEAAYSERTSVGGEDAVAWIEFVGALELAIGGVPEGVVFSGGDDLAIDREIDNCVPMDKYVGDLLDGTLAGLGPNRRATAGTTPPS